MDTCSGLDLLSVRDVPPHGGARAAEPVVLHTANGRLRVESVAVVLVPALREDSAPYLLQDSRLAFVWACVVWSMGTSSSGRLTLLPTSSSRVVLTYLSRCVTTSLTCAPILRLLRGAFHALFLGLPARRPLVLGVARRGTYLAVVLLPLFVPRGVFLLPRPPHRPGTAVSPLSGGYHRHPLLFRLQHRCLYKATCRRPR
jgi:hypothetical protein